MQPGALPAVETDEVEPPNRFVEESDPDALHDPIRTFPGRFRARGRRLRQLLGGEQEVAFARGLTHDPDSVTEALVTYVDAPKK